MGLVLLIAFMFVAYGLTTLFRRWIDIPTLLAVAIGCAVNANIFNPYTAPIVVGPFTFSIEIVLYTLFMYTIIVRILDYSYADAKRMTFTSIAAILISAFIELMALLMTKNDVSEAFKSFAIYVFSSIGTVAGVWIMVLITIVCRKKNISPYLIIPFAIIPASLIHAAFFYGGMIIVYQNTDVIDLGFGALGTIIGKAVCILLSIFCYFINQKWWRPLNLVAQEAKNADNENE